MPTFGSTSTRTRFIGLLAGASLVAAPIVNTALAEQPAVEPSSAVEVPTPEEFFGFAMGTTGELADFPAVKEYLSLIGEESDRVDYEVVDTTTMGNEYPALFVSAPDNLERLDEIVEANKELASGALSDDEARAVAAGSVPVVMLEATLHSTEVSSTQAVVDIVHRFATEDSEYTDEVLNNVVMMVLPSGNPDGQHLVVDYFKETAGTDYARTYPDLYHRYVGHDNNRDWITFSQRESKTRNRLEREYRPVMTHFMHQQGNSSERIFLPPYAHPISENVDTLAFQSANTVGAHMARELFGEGKTGLRTDAQRYGIFWNADVAGYSSFVGASLVLTEIASATNLAYPQVSRDGGPLGPQDRHTGFLEPYTESTWTLEQMVDYATSAAYAGVEYVAQDPESWLFNNLHQVNRNNREAEDRPYAYVLPADQRDPYATYELLSIFDFGEVEIHRATEEFTAGGTTYAAGTHVVRTAQPVGAWVHQLLEVDTYPDNARNCADCPLILPYSETTDNLAMLFGVEVDPVEEEFDAALELLTAVAPAPVEMPADPGAQGAYLVAPESYGVAQFLAALQEAGVPVFRSADEFETAGESFAPGTVVVPATAAAREVLTEVSTETGLPVVASTEVPQVEGFQLEEDTRVGLIRGINNMPGGWMEWMFTEWGIDYEVVEADHYADLGERYDTVVLADGVTQNTIVNGLNTANYPERFHWARGVGAEGWDQLAGFVEDGGNLVAIGRATATATALLDLPIENAISDAEPAVTIPGALLWVDYDPSVPAAWGMPESWPTWFNRDGGYELTGDAEVASRYAEDRDLLASGYAEGEEALAGLPHVMTFDVGEGQATVASSQVTFRSWTRATLPLITNSVYQGPSEAVDAPDFPAAATFEALLALIDQMEQDGTVTASAAASLTQLAERAQGFDEAGQTARAVSQLTTLKGRARTLVSDATARAELTDLVDELIAELNRG